MYLLMVLSLYIAEHSALGFFLKILVQVLDGANIHLATLEKEVHKREYHNDAVDEDIPVHQVGCWVRECREEGEDQCYPQVHDGNAINPDTSAAERELAWKEGLTIPSLDEHTRYADDVGREESTGAQRRHGIERDSASYVDEG